MSNIDVKTTLIHIDNLFIEYCNIFNEINKSNNYTFSQYILNNLNYYEIYNYINCLKTCVCCKRHTGYHNCLNLKKPVDYTNIKNDECGCNCRHYKRDLQLSLTYYT